MYCIGFPNTSTYETLTFHGNGDRAKVFHMLFTHYELLMKCQFMDEFMDKLTFHVHFMANQTSSVRS